MAARQLISDWLSGTSRSNVWLGVTAEDQRRANERIPILCSLPAPVRFVSAEPLLEAVDFSPWLGAGCAVCGERVRDHPLADRDHGHGELSRASVAQVIVGGESGPKARRFNVAWARDAVRQCREAGAKAWVKQMGSNLITRNDDRLTVGRDDEDPPGWDIDPGRVEENINGFREEYQGAKVRLHLVDRAGRDPAEWPADLRIFERPEPLPVRP